MTNQLLSFTAKNLFGLYNHRIRFNVEDRITAIIGPNGRGKTVCLKLIEALFQKNYEYFTEFPYDEIEFYFSRGETVTILPKIDKVEDELEFDVEINSSIEITFRDIHEKMEVWEPSILRNDNYLVRRISRYVPFLSRIGPNQWIDDRDGEHLSSMEIVSRYRSELPPNIRQRFKDNEPEAFRELIGSIDCQLIETQRLLVLGDRNYGEAWIPPSHRRNRAVSSEFAVHSKAQHLRDIIEGTLAQYATLSQSLDRTFPRRVIEHSSLSGSSEQNLRLRLRELDNKRSELMAAGILDKEMEPVSIAGERIEQEVAKVLEIYAEDTEKKLKVFDDLLAKITTLTEIISQRFIDKSLEIDRTEGFKVSYAGNREIPLEKLSSGEQHQLILIYDLLFEVGKNSLILIDEPELSLHVSWQKKFIEGLERMISLNGFDVVIATHSPPLVARHMDLTIELGDVEDPR